MAAVQQCPDAGELKRFLLGQLTAQACAGLEQHIQQCRRCGTILPTLPADDDLVSALRAKTIGGPPAPERDLVDQLMLRLQVRRPATSDTTTGERTVGVPGLPDGARDLCGFLAPGQGADEIGRLGPFRVLKVLGHGGMGVVFQAEDTQLQRSVAIKAMLPEVAKKTMARERFLREARAAAALQHDHIVAIYHVGEDSGVPYLVMPLLKGASLEAVLKKKEAKAGTPLTVGQILKLSREIAKGLAAAHVVGLIHRDIKPANIWLDATTGGRVKILDFGLARATTDDAQLTSPGMVVGTPSYMAPEQAQGQPVDGRADLFSLGCVLYRLCTGQVPFQGTDALSTLLLVATAQPTPVEQLNPQLPPDLCALIRRLMAKSPLDRSPSAQAVVDEIQQIERALRLPTQAVVEEIQQIERAQAGRAPSGLEDTKAVAVQRPSRRLPRAIAATVLLLAGAALAAFIVVSQKHGAVSDNSATSEAVVPPRQASAGKEWVDSLRKLAPAQQVDAVAKKLQECNPGFDGTVRALIKDNAVEQIALSAENITDVSPLQALPELRVLKCSGTSQKTGPLADLSPLRGMRLRGLDCSYTCVADLAPLKDMKISQLGIDHTKVSDLAPLRGMALNELRCDFEPGRDAAVLKSLWTLDRINGQPAIEFWKQRDVQFAAMLEWIDKTSLMPAQKRLEAVRAMMRERNPNFDGALTPVIRDSEVVELIFKTDQVVDISPLRSLPWLTKLSCFGTYHRKGSLIDLGPLRGMRLTYLNCAENPIRDLTPLQHLPLVDLSFAETNVTDLAPLRGLRLTKLACYYCTKGLTDLTPLQGMPIRELNIGGNGVRDLTPLRGMPLERLYMKQTGVRDLTPLEESPLRYLECTHMKAPDFNPLRKTAIHQIDCDRPEQQAASLTALWTLEKIHDRSHMAGTTFEAVDFFDKRVPTHAAMLRWLAVTRKLPADKQLEQVKAKLKERNPELDVQQVEAKVLGPAVWELTLPATVADLSPVRALHELRSLKCSGTATQPGKLSDLSPLVGMNRLDRLDVAHTAVQDLYSLKFIPLQHLGCSLELARNHRAMLYPSKNLQTINNQPVAAFWKEMDAKKP